MSSHHIVRDDQEPALIIANGAPCSQELLNELLEWSPMVIVLDSAIERVLALNIKIDVLIGDFDRNFDYKYYENLQYPLKVIKIDDQDTTDLDKALQYLISKRIPSVNIIWATGYRADHTITNITNLVRYEDRIKAVILDDHSKIFVLPKEFKKWYPKNTVISLIPVGEVTGICSENLRYTLNNDTLTLGMRTGSSNSVSNDGIVSIKYEKGALLMMECFD